MAALKSAAIFFSPEFGLEAFAVYYLMSNAILRRLHVRSSFGFAGHAESLLAKTSRLNKKNNRLLLDICRLIKTKNILILIGLCAEEISFLFLSFLVLCERYTLLIIVYNLLVVSDKK